jgi:galactonate dehydratase
MYRSGYFEGGRILTGAISAIDMALHDVVARRLGVPVYQLLGGAQRDSVPCFGTVGESFEGDHRAGPARAGGPEMVADAVRLSREYQCVRLVYDGRSDASKIFEPRESIATTAEFCIAARKACGAATVLGLEWHHRLSVAEAGARPCYCNYSAPTSE